MSVTKRHIYQTISAWSLDQGSAEINSSVNNFAPTVTVGAELWTAKRFLFYPWSMDQDDLAW